MPSSYINCGQRALDILYDKSLVKITLCTRRNKSVKPNKIATVLSMNSLIFLSKKEFPDVVDHFCYNIIINIWPQKYSAVKGLEHWLLGWKVLIYKYNLDISISQEMSGWISDLNILWLHS